jgi:hypothetical protein
VSEARFINRAEILTARTDATAEAAEVSAAEAAAAETTVAAGAAVAAEAAAAAGAAAKAAADAPGALAALAPELPKELGGGEDGRRGDPREARAWCGDPRGLENSRRAAQQRGSQRGSPGREIDAAHFFLAN